MKDFLEKLEFNFYSELENLQTQENNPNSSLELCRKYLADLKNEIINRGFNNPKDEIDCFKITKPKLHAELLYFRSIIMLHLNLPLGSDEIKKNYLNNHLIRFHLFFEENKEFILYYRSGSTYLDEHFFIRKNARVPKNSDEGFSEVDFRWNTGHDITLAKYLAFEKLERQIRHELHSINNLGEVTFPPPISRNTPEKTLKWTESKTALVELIYALHSVCAVNNGLTNIKNLSDVLQNTFQIELGDHYRVYHDLKSRKIHRTKFLDNLTEALNRRMKADDEK